MWSQGRSDVGSIRKRNGKFQAQVRRDGVPDISKTFTTRKDATVWVRGLEVRIDAGETTVAAPKAITLADVLLRYSQEVTPHKKGREPEQRRLNRLLRDPISQVLLGKLDSMTLARFRDRRVKDGVRAAQYDLIIIRHALKTFSGVQRRFQKVGNYKETIIIDDYGHHPVEIDSALSAARLLTPKNKIISIFQPHRYSRLRDLFHDFCSCFNDADKVLLLDVYSAGEDVINGFESKNLEEGLIKYGHKDVSYIENPQKLANLLSKIINPGDVVIFLGAGTVTKIANRIEQDLKNENR